MLTLWNTDLSVEYRMILAFVTSLVFSLVLGGPLINFLRSWQKFGQPIREDGPQSHLQTKKGTPTMGGILILGTAILSIFLFANITYHFVWVSMLILIMYGLTGFLDDYWKVKRQSSNAMTAGMKLFLQFLTALIAASIITAATPRGINTVLFFPDFDKILMVILLLCMPFICSIILAIGGMAPDNKESWAMFYIFSFSFCMVIYILLGVFMYKHGVFGLTETLGMLIGATSETSSYIKDFFINLSWLYVPFAVIVISGTSNAVNLSDGLDGLASGLLIIVFTFFMGVAYYCGFHNAISHNMLYIPRCSEVAVVCASLIGSCLGFLYFNKPKAKVFMGDTGSLALGAVLGAIAVMTKSEILLAIVGGVFVAETVSVMIQVLYFKATGKRFFKMAPIHHHFEQLGWSEKKVVLCFWGTAIMLAALGSLAFI